MNVINQSSLAVLIQQCQTQAETTTTFYTETQACKDRANDTLLTIVLNFNGKDPTNFLFTLIEKLESVTNLTNRRPTVTFRARVKTMSYNTYNHFP